MVGESSTRRRRRSPAADPSPVDAAPAGPASFAGKVMAAAMSLAGQADSVRASFSFDLGGRTYDVVVTAGGVDD